MGEEGEVEEVEGLVGEMRVVRGVTAVWVIIMWYRSASGEAMFSRQMRHLGGGEWVRR